MSHRKLRLCVSVQTALRVTLSWRSKTVTQRRKERERREPTLVVSLTAIAAAASPTRHRCRCIHLLCMPHGPTHSQRTRLYSELERAIQSLLCVHHCTRIRPGANKYDAYTSIPQLVKRRERERVGAKKKKRVSRISPW